MRKLIEKYFLYLGMDQEPATVFSWLSAIILIAFIVFRIGEGVHEANDVSRCKASSINDILLSPAYALGCNLAKNRFDIRLN